MHCRYQFRGCTLHFFFFRDEDLRNKRPQPPGLHPTRLRRPVNFATALLVVFVLWQLLIRACDFLFSCLRVHNPQVSSESTTSFSAVYGRESRRWLSLNTFRPFLILYSPILVEVPVPLSGLALWLLSVM